MDRAGGDKRSFDHPVGVVAKNAAVLERAGLPLGAVDDDGSGRPTKGVVSDGLPLPAAGEAGAAAPAQSRVEHGGDDLLRAHLVGGDEPTESADGAVLVERGEHRLVQHAPRTVGWAAIVRGRERCDESQMSVPGRSVSGRRLADRRVDHGRGEGKVCGHWGVSRGERAGWAVWLHDPAGTGHVTAARWNTRIEVAVRAAANTTTTVRLRAAIVVVLSMPQMSCSPWPLRSTSP